MRLQAIIILSEGEDRILLEPAKAKILGGGSTKLQTQTTIPPRHPELDNLDSLFTIHESLEEGRMW